MIYDDQNQPFLVYCDLESEPEFVWALIQSFSLENKDWFRTRGFHYDYPVDEDSLEVDWNLHRLSLSHMQHLAGNSTHLRATCNFHAEGLSYTDYARADLKVHGYIFQTWFRHCKRYEYLNIRGIDCYDCTPLTNQPDGQCWFLNSYTSPIYGCEYDGRPGMGSSEYNFGQYRDGKINPEHRCTSSPYSTTEHWFGVKRDV